MNQKRSLHEAHLISIIQQCHVALWDEVGGYLLKCNSLSTTLYFVRFRATLPAQCDANLFCMGLAEQYIFPRLCYLSPTILIIIE
jgi:hypothetical protein